MSESSETAQGGGSAQPVGPTEPVGLGFIASFAGAYLFLWIALLTPIMVSLAIRVQQIDPENKETSLSLVLALGAFLAMIANPFFGKLSDRTTSRFGMRRPWLVAGAAVGALGLLVIALGETVPAIIVGWCLTQVALNASLAVSTALLPDQVPPGQRGRLAGIMGTCTSVAMVAGAFIVRQLSTMTLWMFMVPALLNLAATLVLVAVLKDRRIERSQVPPYSVGEFFRSFWVNPAKYPDFGWAWLGRFMRFMGISFVMSYQAYYLIDHLHQDPMRVAHLIFLGTLIATAAAVVGANVGGFLSDRTKRRKVFVMTGSCVFGGGLLTLALSHSLPYFFVASGIVGLGQGLFMALDFALAADVLPEGGREAAKDLGVFNIANSMPQWIAPSMAPALLAIGAGHNYPVLFAMGTIFAVLGAVVIKPVRGVR